MTTGGHDVSVDYERRSGFASAVARAGRGLRRHPIILAALALAVLGGVTVAALALNSSSGFQSAAVCRKASSYVYAVPSYPLQAPPAPAWPPPQGSYWGWMVRKQMLRVGDRVRLDTGGSWRVTAIAALPIDCEFMGMNGLRAAGGTVAGRLILQPVR
jgi:hypothetical protein